MADIIVVHGVPGAGKSTHCKKLTQYSINGRPVFHLSAGELLRAIRIGELDSTFSAQVNRPEAPSPLGHKLVNDIMFEKIHSYPLDSIILIDGYPIFPDAVDPFVETIKEGNHNLLGCLHLKISIETSMSRLSARGIRRGERFIGITPGVVEKRYWEYLTHTIAAIEALGEIAPVINIDTEPNQQVAWESFGKAVNELINKAGLHYTDK